MIPVAEPYIDYKEIRYINKCLKSGWISSIGEYVDRFEQEFSKFCGTRYGVAVSNGTAALHLALVSFGIGHWDEVIMPTLTFVATANAVSYTGAKPVFVDSDPVTWNIDINKIEEAITKKTKAIIPVHLYGHPADMDPILKIAKKYNLYIIEDAAEAHGALYKGKRTGSFGDTACFSFYGNKIITTGEGGMVVTNYSSINKKLRFFRDHGMSSKRRYYHSKIAYNYRLTNMQAALGLAQMHKIDLMIKKKRENAFLYNKLLKDIEGIILPPEEPYAKSVFWLYSVLIEEDFGISRNQLMEKLKNKGIDTRPFFIPMHRLPMYKTNRSFPVSDRLSTTGISLPSSIRLDKKDIEYICNVIKNIWERRQ